MVSLLIYYYTLLMSSHLYLIIDFIFNIFFRSSLAVSVRPSLEISLGNGSGESCKGAQGPAPHMLKVW